MNSIATAISNGRTDTSFVDDLNALRGTVNSRVALLLRSIEVHPFAAKMCCSYQKEHTPPHFQFLLKKVHTRVFLPWPWERTAGNHQHTSYGHLDRRKGWECGGMCSSETCMCVHRLRAHTDCLHKEKFASPLDLVAATTKERRHTECRMSVHPSVRVRLSRVAAAKTRTLILKHWWHKKMTMTNVTRLA